MALLPEPGIGFFLLMKVSISPLQAESTHLVSDTLIKPALDVAGQALYMLNPSPFWIKNDTKNKKEFSGTDDCQIVVTCFPVKDAVDK